MVGEAGRCGGKLQGIVAPDARQAFPRATALNGAEADVRRRQLASRRVVVRDENHDVGDNPAVPAGRSSSC